MHGHRIRTPGNSFRELVQFFGGGFFTPLGREQGVWGQGLCGPAPLARTRVLEDTPSVYSGARGPSGGKLCKVKEGVRPDDCQGRKSLLRLTEGQLTSWGQVRRGAGTRVETLFNPSPTEPRPMQSHRVDPQFPAVYHGKFACGKLCSYCHRLFIYPLPHTDIQGTLHVVTTDLPAAPL